ncbi:MAG: hypothetical protein DME22_16790, partial [Verrucomicrobia bacterium]
SSLRAFVGNSSSQVNSVKLFQGSANLVVILRRRIHSLRKVRPIRNEAWRANEPLADLESIRQLRRFERCAR